MSRKLSSYPSCLPFRFMGFDWSIKFIDIEASDFGETDSDKKEVRMTSDGKTYVFPVEDCIFLPFGSITAENLAEYVLNIIISKIKFPKNIKKIEIGVDEGFGQGARIEKNVS